MTDPVANRRVLAAGRPSPPHPVDQTVLLLARLLGRQIARDLDQIRSNKSRG